MSSDKESILYKILEWIIIITVTVFMIYKLYEMWSMNN
jgi:hypothetical protein